MHRMLLFFLLNLIPWGFFNSAYADDTPSMTCYLSDKNATSTDFSAQMQTAFLTKTPIIYYICKSSEVEKDQVVRAVWTSVNTYNAAPPNYEIAEKSIKVLSDASDPDHIWTGEFSMSIPESGWPSGIYRVDVYVNNNLGLSQTFTFE